MSLPATPWTGFRKRDQSKQNSFPELKGVSTAEAPGAAAAKPPAIDYNEVQQNEVEALQSIYMEDFEEAGSKTGAWNKSADHTFKLHLKASSDPEASITLSVTMTATYPKTLPLLSVSDAAGLRLTTRSKIDEILEKEPREHLGSEMIFDLTSSIHDALEEEVQLRAEDKSLPSLEEERATQEAEAQRRAQREDEEIRRKKQEESIEEERMLGRMVEEELKRRKDKAREIRRKSKPPNLEDDLLLKDEDDESNHLIFDRQCRIKDSKNNFITFRKVVEIAKLHHGPVTEVLTVRPISLQKADLGVLVVKQVDLKGTGSPDSLAFKREVQSLEQELERLKGLQHPNILGLLESKVNRYPEENVWRVSVLTELANKGSLEELLDMVGSVGVQNLRSWAIQILEGLDFLHRNGVVHKDLHASNVLLFRPAFGGTTIVKLADGGYQRHLHYLRNQADVKSNLTAVSRSVSWFPPELAQSEDTPFTRKTDIWDFGVVFLQMAFGLSVLEKHTSPDALIESVELSDSLFEFLRKIFRPDPKKRCSAFDILPCEFLRNDDPLLVEFSMRPANSQMSSSASLAPPTRIRHDSVTMVSGNSRYANDFVEAGRLGKGGFGEVVKARNKLDHRVYAIKKITQTSRGSLTDVLSEIILLSRLNHPYVVRYYTAWMEEDFGMPSDVDGDAVSFTGSSLSSSGGPSIEFGPSTTGGLDFISSTGYPQIQFENDSEVEKSDSEAEGEQPEAMEEALNMQDADITDGNLKLKRTRSGSRTQRPVKSTLYIQMEYCEKHTLRDLLRQGLASNVDDSWRLFRQILEGLSHIHGHGIIHRDLKPDNIFIDEASNPRIGDFGLATSGQYHLADKESSSASHMDSDLTTDIGTTLYVAPELRSSSNGHYNDKVDMYSLGIIFFEMCYPLKTAMERDHVIRNLREKDFALPSEFESESRVVQGYIINSLLKHRPNERPSSAELLQSGKLPVQIEDETIQEALRGLSDPDSPYYQKIMSAIFSQPTKQAKDYAWDMGTAAYGPHELLLQSTVKEILTSIFRHHGAVEATRSLLFPRSSHYSNNVVQLLDSSGTLVQLPYDLTLPHARAIARRVPPSQKSFAFGNVYRDSHTGGQPRSHGEVDFDIVSYDSLDLTLKEAEVIKVIDEIVDAFPSMKTAQMCFHINHSDLLEVVMEYCQINVPQRAAVKEILSKLNIGQWTWLKIRNELRAPSLGVSSTSVDDLVRFDFRDSPERAFQKLRSIFEGTGMIDRCSSVFVHINSVMTYLNAFNVRRKIYVSPLSSFNDNFYKGGLMFQCLYDTKRKDVFAAGGRYDRLILQHRPKLQGQFQNCHAVGFNLGWEKIFTSMNRFQKNSSKAFLKKTEEGPAGPWSTRRCDVLVASFCATTLRTAGVNIVQELWANGISAELSIDSRSPEELLSHYQDDKHSWIVIIKQDNAGSNDRNLKVKNMIRKEDSDIRSPELLSWLRNEIRERDRDRREVSVEKGKSLASQPLEIRQSPGDREHDVRVLISLHRGKKSNRRNVIEAGKIPDPIEIFFYRGLKSSIAVARTQELVQGFLDGPIAAIEIRDDVLDMIRETRLSDPDSWRKVIQSVPLTERKYLGQVHELLGDLAKDTKVTTRNAFIYNFRTGACIYYDLERQT